ncbi:hypothetical protein HALO59_100281 [Halomonas sp. 59]|nr:hypothetical protein HALO59_100281 [Halomonas sp. 59]CAD5248843.1 hypothetical protein HALO113_100303 [Halomonas sp. 113]VXC01955.1 hypothetical protein HALO153_230177 [Halomonas titanicae]
MRKHRTPEQWQALVSATLLAYVATAKYQDALPLYRQSQILPAMARRFPATPWPAGWCKQASVSLR